MGPVIKVRDQGVKVRARLLKISLNKAHNKGFKVLGKQFSHKQSKRSIILQ